MPRKKLTEQIIEQENSRAKKWPLIILTIIFFLLIGFVFHKNLYRDSTPKTEQLSFAEPITEIPKIDPVQKEEKPLSTNFALKVPFTPQAPTANWDELHNDACEEASSIMAYAYFNDISELSPKLVEQEITKLTNWQKQNFGYYLSIDTEETARMIEEVYELKTEITDMTEQKIKRALAENKLVIYAGNGQMLGNPYFKPPGPIYHMLVITGWDEENFITNDPGTRRGLNYEYNYETLYEAAGDWSHTTHKVELKNKKIIIISK